MSFRFLSALLAGLILKMLSSVVLGKSAPDDAAAADAFFTNSAMPILKVEIGKAQMNSLRREPRAYVKGIVREGPITYTNVLIRLKGGAGSFRPVDDKPGLTLSLEDSNALFHGLNKIHLNNSVQDSTYLSEWLCSELFRQAGVPAPRAAPVFVELNGQRLGLFVLLESVDRQFLGRYFKNTHGNVYSPSWNSDITGPLECIGGRENNGRADLKALAQAARSRDAGRLAKALDVERFLSFLALEVMLCHWDGYTYNVKNYLVYHDLDANRMVFIPHDMDQMLQDSDRPLLPQATGMVSKAVLTDRSTKKLYLQRVSQLSTNVFNAAALTRRIDAEVASLTPAIKAYDPDLARQFGRQARGLKARVVHRATALEGELNAIDSTLLSR